MLYILHAKLKKKIRKLSPMIKERLRERLELFTKDSTHISLNNHAVEKAYPGCRSIDITGDYRAIYYVKGEVAVFIHAGTHPELYR